MLKGFSWRHAAIKLEPGVRPDDKRASYIRRRLVPTFLALLIFAVTGWMGIRLMRERGSSEPGRRFKPASLELKDDFEGTRVAAFWLPGEYGSGRFAPGRIEISTNYVRSGRTAVRITVHEGDVRQKGDDGIDTERAELDSGKHPFLDQEVWYAYSFLIPEGFPVVDNRLIISQWKQNGVHGGPLLAERYRGGRHYLTIREPNAFFHDQKRFDLPAIEAGRWNDMVWRICFSKGNGGSVDLWMNGEKIVTYRGATAFPEGENRFYHKIGLYRDRWPEPMTIYFDRYQLGGARPVDKTNDQ